MSAPEAEHEQNNASELRRASRSARVRAALAGIVALAALHIPLIVGYATTESMAWQQITDAGYVPAPLYYAPWPLQFPRLILITLFSLNIATWIALLTLLPLDEDGSDVFASMRRRLRRRWLYAHAPLFPVAAFMGGARLYGESLTWTGAGASWFRPALISTSHPNAATAWIASETAFLSLLSAGFAVHLIFLAGVVRPRHWMRNLTALALTGGALLAIDWYVLLPMADGGLFHSQTLARRAADRACSNASEQPDMIRSEMLFNTLQRTVADSPALRMLHPVDLPPSAIALPPLPWLGFAGVPVRLTMRDGDGGVLRDSSMSRNPFELEGGWEYRLDIGGTAQRFPASPACVKARVLKIDRGLRWHHIAPLLREVGGSEVLLAFRSAPIDRAIAPVLGPGPEMIVVGDGGAIPAGIPRSDLPLAFRLPPEPSRRATSQGPWAHLPPERRKPFERTLPSDPLWHRRLPEALPPPMDEEMRTTLVVTSQSAWDDLLRAIAAASKAGAKTIYVLSS